MPSPSAPGSPALLPRVSVVIPSARGGPYLREAVNSVLSQSFTDFELIIVADGCEDDLLDVKVLDERIRIIRETGRGVSIARNVGIHAARSDLVAFLDDDDRMRPERLAAQHEIMTTQPHIGLCHTQFQVIDDHGLPNQIGRSCDVQYIDLLQGQVSVLMPTIMVRKSLLEELGTFDCTLVTGEDLDLIYRFARERPLAFLPKILTEYRRHGSNLSGDVRTDAGVLIALLRKHQRAEEQRGHAREAAAARQGVAWASRYGATGAVLAGRAAWRRGDILVTVRCLWTAMRLSPAETVHDLVGNRWPGHRLPGNLRRSVVSAVPPP